MCKGLPEENGNFPGERNESKTKQNKLQNKQI